MSPKHRSSLQVRGSPLSSDVQAATAPRSFSISSAALPVLRNSKGQLMNCCNHVFVLKCLVF